MMLVYNKSLKEISNHEYLRADVKYWDIIKNYNFKKFIKLKDLFTIINGSVQTKNYTEEKTSIPYVRISNLNHNDGISLENIIYLDENANIIKDKILKKNDLVLATIGATVGKIGKCDNVVGGTNSNNTVILRAKNDNINVDFYYRLLKSKYYYNYFLRIASQKAQPNLQEYDLKNIIIPNISEDIQNIFNKKVEPNQNKIIELQKQKDNIRDIIDNEFLKYFDYNYKEFEKQKKKRKFTSTIVNFSNNVDLRFSTKFHREAGQFVYSEIKSRPYKLMKKIIEIPTITGQGISPNDFDENGEYYYVSMADMSEWKIDEDNLKRVSADYSESHKSKRITGNSGEQPTTLLKGDILLMRSGEGGIGKTAIVDKDINAIFCDFIIRIRVNKKMFNPYFVYYFTRTSYFQYLIEINKKGLGNNTNIFPNILDNFPIPYISIEDQNKIVEVINCEINKQDEIEKQIINEQNEIEKVLLEIIK